MQHIFRRSSEIVSRLLVGFSALAWASLAQAGRPMIVDDAGIVAYQSCQIESWRQKNYRGFEYWAVPACNFTGNLELAFGGAVVYDDIRTNKRAQIQAKTVFKPLDINGWGAGLVIGNQFDPHQTFNGDLYARVPVSWSFSDDRVLVHTNVGWVRTATFKQNAASWGIGTELKWTEKTALSAEVFGQQYGKSEFQFGIRHALIADRLQLSASYGNRTGQGQNARFVSIGITLQSDSILP
ncbi:hypothetical protein [Undibacterium flavidum]|uniref:hypothetical protein n=1 Tax=Undibacterium flavidum TaxID=2762297 RepID=UPI001E454BC8|nr:hypothetical protein [Undibacterium flavidum]